MNWSEFEKGIFLVNVLGIIYNPQTKLILIGKRENDPYIKELSWCFPGGRPSYNKDLEDSLREEIKKKTNLEVDVKNTVFAKTYPEKREFMAVYFCCITESGQEKAEDSFTELKWVRPTDVKKYFTTSLHPTLFKYLKSLE